jgi:hypothetical protein
MMVAKNKLDGDITTRVTAIKVAVTNVAAIVMAATCRKAEEAIKPMHHHSCRLEVTMGDGQERSCSLRNENHVLLSWRQQ